ncbi:MAG TPA: HEPN domain-containing protein [Geminicoccaceae bacterium]
MTEALVRPTPRIDHPDELGRLIDEIVREFRPVAIYLFGSRARGDADEESDYDLMVVVPDDVELDRAFYERLWQIARKPGIRATPFLSRRRNFAWRRSEVGTLEYEVENDGVQLYPTHGRAFRRLVRREERRVNVTIVEEWLRRVEKDLTIARKGCEGEDAVPDQSAYHVQQAAEKLVKGALVAHLIRPRKGHEIEEFTALLPDDFPLRDRFLRLDRFSDFAWVFRYPEYPGQEPVPEPSVEQARAWLDEVAALKAHFERWLGERAGEG